MEELVELVGASDTDPGSTIIKDLVPHNAGEGVTKLVSVSCYKSISSFLPKDRVAIIKIDVEGGELEVVETLLPLIERDRPIIIMEVLPTGSEDKHRVLRNEKLLTILRGVNYEPYRICKTNSDTYAGIAQIDNIGEYSNPTLKDHIFVALEKKDELERSLTRGRCV